MPAKQLARPVIGELHATEASVTVACEPVPGADEYEIVLHSLTNVSRRIPCQTSRSKRVELPLSLPCGTYTVGVRAIKDRGQGGSTSRWSGTRRLHVPTFVNSGGDGFTVAFGIGTWGMGMGERPVSTYREPGSEFPIMKIPVGQEVRIPVSTWNAPDSEVRLSVSDTEDPLPCQLTANEDGTAVLTVAADVPDAGRTCVIPIDARSGDQSVRIDITVTIDDE